MVVVAGFGTFVGIAWLPDLLDQPPGATMLSMLGIADIVGAIVLYRRRGHFLRLSYGTQSITIASSWLVHSAAFALCLYLNV